MLKKTIFLIALFLVGCHVDIKKEEPLKSKKDTIINTTKNSESQQIEPVKKTVIYKIDNLPPQFYITGQNYVLPNEPYSLDIQTRSKEPGKLITYYVETPMLFVDEITSIDSPIISDSILKSLSTCLIENDKKELITYDIEKPILAIGKFSLLGIKDIFLAASESGWIQHSIQVSHFNKPGIYLLEMRIGPQIAHLVIVANTINHVVRNWGDKNLLWVTEKGVPLVDIPVFYKDEDGNTQEQRTDKDGVAFISALSPWILVWQDSKIDVIMQRGKNYKEELLWTDKDTYATNEPIHCAWARPGNPLVQVFAKNLETVHEQKIEKNEQSTTISIKNQIPGEYKISVGNSSKIIHIYPDNVNTVQNLEIISDRCVYSPNDIISIYIYGLKENEVTLNISNTKNEIVDRQIQKQQDGTALFYLQLKEGEYELEVHGKRKRIMVVGSSVQPQEIIPQELFNEKDINIFLPNSPEAKLFSFEGKVNDYYVQNQGEKGDWRLFSAGKQSGKWSFHSFSAHSQQSIELYVNAPIKVNFPDKVYVTDSINVKVDFPITDEYKYLLWATNEIITLEQKTQQHKNSSTSSDARNIPQIYKKWVEKKITEDYANAIIATTKKQYSTSIYLCQQILKWAPEHKPSQELLQKSIQSIQNMASDSPIVDRLKYTYINNIHPELKFDELIEKIEEQANVYIEVDPAVYEKHNEQYLLLKGLPSEENAFSLLSYLFATRSLTYKVENGTFFITLKSTNVLENLVDKMDENINQQLKKLSVETTEIKNATQQPIFKTTFWTGWQKSQNTSKVSFPTSGMWTIYCIVLDKQNTPHFLTQNIWVNEKLR